MDSVYEFNGIALQHTNLDVETRQRCTLLIHFYDPGLPAGPWRDCASWQHTSMVSADNARAHAVLHSRIRVMQFAASIFSNPELQQLRPNPN
ncbi:hypothetical protein FVF58_08590 [Paraburkholderia panacisoli]|uniref:Uncharacterized protein n=1 Tax=Paraburkholderia panacisoli TaxID=2603818 RepID=A0A5B0HFC4_9BURK|nr:hypothetical protein FVF58_08590 [Paraburkholderia panacisoli]